MKVVITIQHPAHVHFFKYPIEELESDGHEVHVFYRDGELIKELLESYNINAIRLVAGDGGGLSTAVQQLRYEHSLYQFARQIEPDVMAAVGGIAVAHISAVVGAKSIVFTDSGDHAWMNRLGTHFADVICTPACLETDYGEKQIRYDGYHELAYLHPNRFEPDTDCLRSMNVSTADPYSVVRFISWEAQHDIGQFGFGIEDKRRLLAELDQYGDVFVTTEGRLPAEFEKYQLPVAPDQIHQLLYHADLYIGDSQTMATEAAVLGTPAIRSNSFAGENDMDNFIELENRYGLLRSTPDSDRAMWKAVEFLNSEADKRELETNRETMLEEKIDVTAFVTDVIKQTAQREI